MKKHAITAALFMAAALTAGSVLPVMAGPADELTAPAEPGSLDGMTAVVIGGGTGAPVSIRTLLNLGAQTSAVVAMGWFVLFDGIRLFKDRHL